MWRNTNDKYGWVSIGLHWLVACVVIGLFALGLWMVELDYYHPWYRSAPDLHKSLGVSLFIIMLLRLWWRWSNPQPHLNGKPWEQQAAHRVHGLLYVLLYALMVSGYFISTADGRPIEVFGLFNVPATLTGKNQEDLAGEVHEWLAYTVVAVASLHAMAALKHHFINRDSTLKRMLGVRK